MAYAPTILAGNIRPRRKDERTFEEFLADLKQEEDTREAYMGPSALLGLMLYGEELRRHSEEIKKYAEERKERELAAIDNFLKSKR